jgi:hypothetical protein
MKNEKAGKKNIDEKRKGQRQERYRREKKRKS